jgi:hypothetical protein
MARLGGADSRAASRTGVAAAVALAAALALSGCSVPASSAPGTATPPTGSTAAAPTRWWSTPLDAVGSAIPVDDPAASAKRLKPDRADYCQALADTLAAGNGIFPDDVDVASDTYRVSALAFVYELQALAPAEVAPAWHDFGSLFVALVDAGGDAAKLTLPQGLSADQVTAASNTIEQDARTQCGLTP